MAKLSMGGGYYCIVKEASNITLGQDLDVFTFYQVDIFLALKGPHWVIDSRILKYQVLLLENPNVAFQRYTNLNLNTLLPCPEEGASLPFCKKTIILTYTIRRDSKD